VKSSTGRQETERPQRGLDGHAAVGVDDEELPRPPVRERRLDAGGVQRRVVVDLDRVRGVAALTMVGDPRSHVLRVA
jgi:hypothetical protein